MIEGLQEEGTAIKMRLGTAEDQLSQLTETKNKLSEAQSEMLERQDGVIWRQCQSLQGLFKGMEGKMQDLGEEMKLLHMNGEQFQSFATQRIQQLFDDDEQGKE